MITNFGGVGIGWEVDRGAPHVRLCVARSCVGEGALTPAAARELAKALLRAAAKAERIALAADRDRCRCTVTDRGVEVCACGGRVCRAYVEHEFPPARVEPARST